MHGGCVKSCRQDARTPTILFLRGPYIVSDPEICHGKPTFHGTRIMVSHVLEQVAEGMSWEAIILEYRGNICKEAITEAVNLANQAFQSSGG